MAISKRRAPRYPSSVKASHTNYPPPVRWMYRKSISTLLEHGLYSSAQILGCFAVSSTSISPETSPHLKAESLVLYGDSLFREKEYRIAIHIYKQALQYHKIIPKQNAAASLTTRSSLSAANRSSSPGSLNPSALNENEIKFKIATCHNSPNENRAALAEELPLHT